MIQQYYEFNLTIKEKGKTVACSLRTHTPVLCLEQTILQIKTAVTLTIGDCRKWKANFHEL
jgi:hypothetical protein